MSSRRVEAGVEPTPDDFDLGIAALDTPLAKDAPAAGAPVDDKPKDDAAGDAPAVPPVPEVEDEANPEPTEEEQAKAAKDAKAKEAEDKKKADEEAAAEKAKADAAKPLPAKLNAIFPDVKDDHGLLSFQFHYRQQMNQGTSADPKDSLVRSAVARCGGAPELCNESSWKVSEVARPKGRSNGVFYFTERASRMTTQRVAHSTTHKPISMDCLRDSRVDATLANGVLAVNIIKSDEMTDEIGFIFSHNTLRRVKFKFLWAIYQGNGYLTTSAFFFRHATLLGEQGNNLVILPWSLWGSGPAYSYGKLLDLQRRLRIPHREADAPPRPGMGHRRLPRDGSD